MLKIELNSKGIIELLKSSEIEDVLKEHADGVQQRAGEGFHIETAKSKERTIVKIKPSSAHAYYSNLKNDTLTKALMGGSKQ